MPASCRAILRDVGAFVDGELTGAERLSVVRHLSECPDCEREIRAIREVSNAIRASAEGKPLPVGLSGLAAGVISRTRAESAQSWRSVLARASEDWHWMMVGGGAVAATFVCSVLLSCVLAFGPRPAREDSLAALITTLTSPAGELFASVTPKGHDQDPVFLPVADGNGDGDASVVTASMIGRAPMPAIYGGLSQGNESEAALVRQLEEAVTRKGRVLTMDEMDPADRHHTELLLDQISKLRLTDQAALEATPLVVHQFRLIQRTEVTAKGS